MVIETLTASEYQACVASAFVERDTATMVRAMVASVLFAGACASSDPPDFGPPLVEIERKNGNVDAVRNTSADVVDLVPFPEYSLDYPATGILLPTSLTFKDMPLLATDVFPFESNVGIAMLPAIRVAGGGAVPQGSSSLVVEIEGLAIVRLKSTYTVEYECYGPQVLTGETTFTIFPHGRIVRHDEVTPNLTEFPDRGCGTGSDGYFFTSFWSFTAPTVGPLDANDQAAGTDSTELCARYVAPDLGIALIWDTTLTEPRLPDPLPPTNSMRFVYDFIDPGVDGAANFVGTVGDADSVLQLAQSAVEPCKTMLDGVKDRQPTINGALASLDDSGFYAIDDPTPDRVTIEATTDGLPAGFAVSLDLGGASHARVTRSDGAMDGVWFIPELDPQNDRIVFWFRDQLPPADSITIEPLD